MKVRVDIVYRTKTTLISAYAFMSTHYQRYLPSIILTWHYHHNPFKPTNFQSLLIKSC